MAMTEERGQQLVGLTARARAKQRTGPTPPMLDMHKIRCKHAAALRCAFAPRRHVRHRCFVHFGEKEKKSCLFARGRAHVLCRPDHSRHGRRTRRPFPAARKSPQPPWICTYVEPPECATPTTTNACHWASNPKKKQKPPIQTEHRSGAEMTAQRMDGWIQLGERCSGPRHARQRTCIMLVSTTADWYLVSSTRRQVSAMMAQMQMHWSGI